jgi:hypothetical protein
MEEKSIEPAAKAMWEFWAQVKDPKWADTRWRNMRPAIKKEFMDQARVCISAYLRLERR